MRVICSDQRFKAKVAVYRHSMTPREISVHILEIYPIPPKEPKVPPEDNVTKVIVPGETVTFEAKLYPGKK